MRIAKIVNIKTQIQHDYCMRGYKIMYKKNTYYKTPLGFT